MTVRFRNVEVDPTSPLKTWPYEALVTLIERGTVSDWSRLTRAIAGDPWGPVARQVEEYLSYSSPYGVAPLLSRAIARARDDSAQQERAAVAAEVAELISRSGLSVADLAERIGTSRSRLSTYRSGRVMPSAAMMHRIRRTVAHVAEPDAE